MIELVEWFRWKKGEIDKWWRSDSRIMWKMVLFLGEKYLRNGERGAEVGW